MIRVTRFNGSKFIINCEWIETIEATPDTMITLVNGNRYIVTEPVDAVIASVVEFKQKAGFMTRMINAIPENDDK